MRLRTRAAGLAAERRAAIARVGELDADLADVNKQVAEGQAALEQLHWEALGRGPPLVEELPRLVMQSGQGLAALQTLQQAGGECVALLRAGPCHGCVRIGTVRPGGFHDPPTWAIDPCEG